MTFQQGKGRQEEGLGIASIGTEGNKMRKENGRGELILTCQWGKGRQEERLRITLTGQKKERCSSEK